MSGNIYLPVASCQFVDRSRLRAGCKAVLAFFTIWGLILNCRKIVMEMRIVFFLNTCHRWYEQNHLTCADFGLQVGGTYSRFDDTAWSYFLSLLVYFCSICFLTCACHIPTDLGTTVNQTAVHWKHINSANKARWECASQLWVRLLRSGRYLFEMTLISRLNRKHFLSWTWNNTLRMSNGIAFSDIRFALVY